MNKLKFCFDCKHYIKNIVPEISRCAKIKKDKANNEYTVVARNKDYLCGNKAVYYQPKILLLK